MSQSDAIEAARKSLDAEIHRLEESICTLRYRRNALAPINSLPPEVLSTIFTAIAAYSDSESDFQATISVCRHWRDTALNHSSLWTTVDFSTPQWRTYFARTKGASLTLVALDFSADFDSFYQVLYQNAYRVRGCESLVFDRLIPTLADIHLPSLRQLKLTNIKMPHNFPSLTHLSLESVKNSTVIDIVDMLKNASLLQSLDLTNIIPQCSEASSSSPCTTIPLTHLSSLRLSDDQLRNCAHFTTHIAFGKTTVVYISTGISATLQEVSDSWDIIFPSQHNDRKYRLAVIQEDHDSVNMSLYDLNQPEVPFRVVGFQDISNPGINNGLQRVCRQTIQRVSHITHLELQGLENSVFSWRELLDGMNELVDLRVRRHAAVFDDLIFDLGEQSMEILLPALRTLHLVGICHTKSPALSALWIPMLQYRKKVCNASLKELKFVACEDSIEGDLDAVEEYVDVLEIEFNSEKVGCNHTQWCTMSEIGPEW